MFKDFVEAEDDMEAQELASPRPRKRQSFNDNNNNEDDDVSDDSKIPKIDEDAEAKSIDIDRKYVVEKILNKRVVPPGKVEYFLVTML